MQQTAEDSCFSDIDLLNYFLFDNMLLFVQPCCVKLLIIIL